MADRPILTEEQVAALEAIYKPRCFNPARETADEHAAWRGKVELVAAFRSDIENRRGDYEDDEPNSIEV